jgi:hypothetical protein
MWMHPSIRDLLDVMGAAAPDGMAALDRARRETLDLLVALFGPAEGEPDAAMRARIESALEAVMQERIARRASRLALV